MSVPKMVVDIINNMLQPYGEKFIPSDEEKRRLVSFDEAARILCVSRTTIHRMTKRGELTKYKISYKKTCYDAAELEKIITSRGWKSFAGAKEV